MPAPIITPNNIILTLLSNSKCLYHNAHNKNDNPNNIISEERCLKRIDVGGKITIRPHTIEYAVILATSDLTPIKLMPSISKTAKTLMSVIRIITIMISSGILKNEPINTGRLEIYNEIVAG